MKKMYKFLATLLAVVSLVSIFPAAALSNNIDDILFDSIYYADHNPDVVKALGRSESALRRHYEQYGKAEGRAPSALFDPKVYVNLYPDIKAAFGTNWTAVYNHFRNNGIAEGRQGSATFSVTAYKNRYADLRNAFGTSSSSNYLYLKHWREFGQREGRIATSGGSTSSSTSSSSSSSTSGTVMYVKTSRPGSNLNLRKSASTSSTVLASLSYGTKLTVLSYTGTWAKVNVNGKTGYVSKQYLSSSNPVSSSSSTSSGKTAAGDVGPLLPSGAYFRDATYDKGMDGKAWTGHHDVNGVNSSTPIYCPFEGTAYYKQATTYLDGQYKLTSYGNYIDLRCDNGYRIILAHLSRFEGASSPITATVQQRGSSKTFPCGTREVSPKDVLGYVGTTGNSTGDHLHIEVYNPSGARVDPSTLFPSLVR